ncbi:hypothetical protein OsI_28454 [Oryza sativa Indica Group]|uniref:Uncharacterized protein n=1 Tax=Oryza sativa subsp. indica TaxID=39946 RepID=B8B8R3_ORYSI|nr:hypothetical protein OsI_28454 [Oryza sativa Indica Group]
MWHQGEAVANDGDGIGGRYAQPPAAIAVGFIVLTIIAGGEGSTADGGLLDPFSSVVLVVNRIGVRRALVQVVDAGRGTKR